MNAGEEMGNCRQIVQSKSHYRFAVDEVFDEPDNTVVPLNDFIPAEGARSTIAVEATKTGIFDQPGTAIALNGVRNLEFLNEKLFIDSVDQTASFFGLALAQQLPVARVAQEGCQLSSRKRWSYRSHAGFGLVVAGFRHAVRIVFLGFTGEEGVDERQDQYGEQAGDQDARDRC